MRSKRLRIPVAPSMTMEQLQEFIEHAKKIPRKEVTNYYEKDDGPLTREQINFIKGLSTATDTPDENFNLRLI